MLWFYGFFPTVVSYYEHYYVRAIIVSFKKHRSHVVEYKILFYFSQSNFKLQQLNKVHFFYIRIKDIEAYKYAYYFENINP